MAGDQREKIGRLKELLHLHDWYYQRSDDQSKYNRGLRQAKVIQELMNELGNTLKVNNMYREKCPWLEPYPEPKSLYLNSFQLTEGYFYYCMGPDETYVSDSLSGLYDKLSKLEDFKKIVINNLKIKT